MNLLVSYDWLRSYVALRETPEVFGARLSLSGPGVERIHSLKEAFQHITVGHVLKMEVHPHADKLHLVTVDLGTRHLKLVCGGSNVQVDQWVVVAEVGAKVRWHGEGDFVTLAPAEIRGVKSEGMICAANEIGLFDAFPHAEKEILDLGQALPDAKLRAGLNVGDLLGLSSDAILDIEVTSNRPDAMNMVGIAREAAAVLNRPLLWKPAPKIKAPIGKPYPVTVRAKKVCPRFTAIKIEGVKVGASPWWMKRRLIAAGVRPINVLVDITNYVMLELGQPMHVYDAKKLAGEKLDVRFAKAGEALAALDGKTYSLGETMLVIADAEKPVGVAGVMGGEATGVTSDTETIVFEAANFDPVSVRRTARALNLYSDAQLRFEKGLSVEGPTDALARAVELCLSLAGGTIVSSVTDIREAPYRAAKYTIGLPDFSALIGVPLQKTQILETLKRLGFGVKIVGKKLTATVPWWRDHDISAGCDLVEEVARVVGYAQIPAIFPAGLPTRAVDPELIWEDRLKTVAKGAGFTELYSYSFVSRELMTKAGYDPEKMLRVQNALTSDFVCMRTTLLPSLLQTVEENQDRFSTQRLFEIAHVYYPKANSLPEERLELGAAVFGVKDAWREAKGFVEHALDACGIDVKEVDWRALTDDAFWHPGRTVQAYFSGTLLATVGELHPLIAERFKLNDRVALIDLPIHTLLKFVTDAKRYTPIPAYPEAKRDLAFVIDRDVTVQILSAEMKKVSSLLTDVQWFDTYRGEHVEKGKKSVALHLVFGAADRTLETKEVDEAMALIQVQLEKTFGIVVRR